MSRYAALMAGRAAAEAGMGDTFAVHGTPAFTKVNGIQSEVRPSMDATPGKVTGRSRESDSSTRTVTVGGVERPVIEGGLHIPISASLPEIGWQYELTVLGPGSDPALLGRRWEVVDVPAKSHATARRLDVVEV